MIPKLPTREQTRKFQELFGCHLRTYWDNFTGFDVISFDDFVEPEDDQSTQDKIREDYGDEAVALVMELLGKPDPVEVTPGDFPYEEIKKAPDGDYFDSVQEAKDAGFDDDQIWSVVEFDEGDGVSYGPPHHIINRLGYIATKERHDHNTYYEEKNE